MSERSEQLHLLSELAAADPWPNASAIRAEHPPWLVDALFEQGWVAVMLNVVVPTLEGLKLLDGEPHRALLDVIRQVRRAIVTWVRAHPNASELDVKAVVAGLQSDSTARPYRALAVLLASKESRGWFTGWSSDGTVPIGVRIEPSRILETEDDEEDELSPSDDLGAHLRVRNFRGLAAVEWSPRGVCLLAGANGSGKTSLLEALGFLHDAWRTSVPKAVAAQRGGTALRRLTAPPDAEITLELAVGPVCWELRLPIEGGAVAEYPGEVVSFRGAVRVRRAAGSASWYEGRARRSRDEDGRTCLRVASESKPRAAWKPLLDVLRAYRLYAAYGLDRLRNGGSGGEDDRQLVRSGANLFFVLRSWQGAPRRFQDRFNWVMGEIKKAFPGQIEGMEFDAPVGRVLPARVLVPDLRESLPAHRVADGLLVGLLHLTAVAGAPDGGIVAIDEMENQLHPHAIRSILDSMRALAEERGLTIILTTHSPVLMNEFREVPEHFFVMEEGAEKLPIPLSELRDPEWLAHFRLGELYDQLEFGAPKPR